MFFSPRRRHLFVVLTVMLGGALAFGTVGTAVAAPPPVPVLPALPGVTTPPLPTNIGPSVSDPGSLYRHPADLASMAPGDVIRAVKRPNPFRTIPSEAWQIAFRTNNSHGKPMVGVTMVLVPFNHRADIPVLSYQMIINAMGMRCQPSQSVYTTTDWIASPVDPWGFNFALARGWGIAIPDHLGEKTAYAAVRMSGQVVLDGIRATTRFSPLRLRKSKFALSGYSGGGMATGAASTLQATYAPEVNIVGSVWGGVPTNLTQMAEVIGTDNSHPAFGLAMAASLGLEREYPKELPISSHLNWLGLQTRAQMANACTNEILAVGFGKSAQMVAKNFDMLNAPETRKVLALNSIASMPEIAKAPVFEFHSPTDPLISVKSLDATMKRYCRAGTKVYQLSTPAPEHLSAAAVGFFPAYEWMADRFAGKPVPSNCRG
ncbi:lipase family protein [Williamsia sp. MIQD14]|uniref:lipase family protein n=1 Tax=Williamsia sp. MIQD14 TaxID=3425703 RepID=UPI003DA09A94